MNLAFFQQVESILATERLDAYRQDGAVPAIALSRYLWNMALCEALYSPLQMAEVALRNSLHRCLSARFGADNWYDIIPPFPPWQQRQLVEARKKLLAEEKPVSPGRMVAELHFGFWTGFFNKLHARTGLGHALAGSAFAHAPRSERDLKKLDARWKRIRDLRNRIFHHERIIHWRDLSAQHSSILQSIAWISPELHEIARAGIGANKPGRSRERAPGAIQRRSLSSWQTAWFVCSASSTIRCWTLSQAQVRPYWRPQKRVETALVW